MGTERGRESEHGSEFQHGRDPGLRGWDLFWNALGLAALVGYLGHCATWVLFRAWQVTATWHWLTLIPGILSWAILASLLAHPRPLRQTRAWRMVALAVWPVWWAALSLAGMR